LKLMDEMLGRLLFSGSLTMVGLVSLFWTFSSRNINEYVDIRKNLIREIFKNELENEENHSIYIEIQTIGKKPMDEENILQSKEVSRKFVSDILGARQKRRKIFLAGRILLFVWTLISFSVALQVTSLHLMGLGAIFPKMISLAFLGSFVFSVIFIYYALFDR
jgi:hypothetical protein